MSVGPDEVKAAVHAMVAAHASCYSRLLVEVVLKLCIYVVENGLPAGVQRGGRRGGGELESQKSSITLD